MLTAAALLLSSAPSAVFAEETPQPKPAAVEVTDVPEERPEAPETEELPVQVMTTMAAQTPGPEVISSTPEPLEAPEQDAFVTQGIDLIYNETDSTATEKVIDVYCRGVSSISAARFKLIFPADTVTDVSYVCNLEGLSSTANNGLLSEGSYLWVAFANYDSVPADHLCTITFTVPEGTGEFDVALDGETYESYIDTIDSEPVFNDVYPVVHIPAMGQCGDSLTWTLDNGTLTISGEGDMWDWSSYSDPPWYDYRSSITSVMIEDGVTSIGYGAFSNCSSLISISLPDSLKSIGDSAFNICSSLTSISLPAGLTTIGDSAFSHCDNLSAINVDENNLHYASVDGVLFNKELTELVAYPGGKGTSYSVPNGVTGIGNNAFRGCDGLTSISLPEGLTSIGSYAFSYCEGLTSISLPEGLTSIGYGTFSNCRRLTSISLPEGLTSIGDYAFTYCRRLTSISLPEGLTSIGSYAFSYCDSLTSIILPAGVTSIEESAFADCDALTDVYYRGTEEEWSAVTIETGNDPLLNATMHYRTVTASGQCGDSVNYVLYNDGALVISGEGDMWNWSYGDQPWYDYRSDIVSVTVESGVTRVGNYAFWGFYGITSISLPNGLISIGTTAFSNCTALTSISLPDGLTTLGATAFSQCFDLTSISLPDSLKSIGDSAFSTCSSLTNISLHAGLTSIGRGAFSKCDSLSAIDVDESNPYYTSVDGVLFNKELTELIAYPGGKGTSYSVPNGVTSIEHSAFSGCDILTNISLPDGLTSIGDWAFEYCHGLTSISLPDGLTSMGDGTFRSCSSLTSISLPGSLTKVGDWVFAHCDGLTSISLPDGVTSIGGYAFYHCDGLTSISLPGGLTSIEESAFYDCDALTDVYYKGRSAKWEEIAIDTNNDQLTDANIHYLVDDAVFTSSTMSAGSWDYTYRGEYHYWEFTPAVTGTYVFESTLSSGDAYGYLYDSSFEQLEYNDDSGEGNNFLITFPATAGETYYLGSRWYSSSSTGSIPVKLSRRYTVSYDANGGSGAPSAQYKKYGESLTLSSVAPSRSGYEFVGWAASSDSVSASYQPGGTMTANGDYTLYAVWRAITYTVSYDANGGSGAPAAQTKTHGQSIALSSQLPTRLGYTFLGWAESANAPASYYPRDTYSANSAVKLYAVWEEGETVQTSSSASASVDIPFGGAVRYFKFVPEASGTYVFASSGSADTYGQIYSSSGSSIVSDDDSGDGMNFMLTLDAVSGSTYYLAVKYMKSASTGSFDISVKRQYTITYNANGGGSAPEAQTKLHGETLTLSSDVPTRAGFNFLGWATSSSAVSPSYTPGSSFTGNTSQTLYAVWSEYPTASAPRITVDTSIRDAKYVIITSDTEGAVIHYTLDGSTPTSSSPILRENDARKVSTEGTTTFKAIAIADGYNDSAVTTLDVTLSRANAPVASVASGSVVPGKQVELTSDVSSEKNAAIYYTTDGSTPTTSSTLYTGAITVTPPMTIKAIAVAGGYITSYPAEYTYTQIDTAVPVISVSDIAGGKSVAITCATDGVDIYYTMNGNTPTVSSSKYSQPITLTSEGTVTVKAIAVKSGYANSAAASQTVTLTKTAAPEASQPSGEIAKGTAITLSTSTAGAAIYYTTDGSTPTLESNIYSGAISVEGAVTIKAAAAANGYIMSDVAEFSYTVPQAAAPTITVSDSDGGKTVTISAETGMEIHYAVNAGTATVSSPVYSEPLTIMAAGTYAISAIAVRSGYIDSAAAESAVIVEKAASPAADLPSGSVVEPGTTVQLTSSTSGARIYYTTDGSEPTGSSTLYSGAITVTESMNIKAIALCAGYVDSDTSTFEYTVMGTASAPSIFVSNMEGGKRVTMTSSTPGARIYYTLDSTTPTESSTLYTEPISITTAGTKVIKAIAVADGYTDSIVSSDTVMVEKLSAPSLSVQGGRVPKGTMLSLTSSGAAGEIYYTTDGSEPSSSSTRYTEPIELTGSVTIKAAAISSGYISSDIVSAEYEVYEKCALPVITVTETQGVKTAQITCATDGASIYYTTDGSTPGTGSTRYSGNIVFDTPVDCALRAVAVKSGFENSDEASRAIVVTKSQAPKASVEEGAVEIGTAVELEGAGTIYYRVNGGMETIYGGSIVIEEDTVIMAYAVEDGSLRSDTVEFAYTVKKITSGTDGAVTWNYNDGILTVNGTGAIPDYTPGAAPWYGQLRNEITAVVMGDGIDTIGSNAFYGLGKVTAVTVPDTLKQINSGAFEGCTSLNAAALPDGMSGGIGSGAFKGCTALKSLTIPVGVTAIEQSAFEGCAGLTEITLPFIGSQSGAANNTDTFTYVFGGSVPSALRRVTITNETSVPENAFAGLENIERITINSGVSSIGSGAFDGCKKLAAFTVPDSVRTIGDNTFRGCESAVSITVPSSVNAIGASAFDGCTKLRSVNVPAGVKYLYDHTFRGCVSLTSIELPTSIETIGEGVLEGCTALVEVKVPFVGANRDPGSSEVTSQGIFGYLFGAESNTGVPASVTKVEITDTSRESYIPKAAFKDCGNIVDIIIDGGRNILDGAFENCRNLKSLFIPKSISSMGSNILAGCNQLETLTIPFIGTNRQDKNSETSVLGGFFGYDDSDITGTIQYYNENGDFHYYKVPRTLKNVSVLNQTTIPAGAFSECDFIERIAIASGGSMERYAFYHCASLRSVSLPNDLESIGYQAFAECERLEDINIPIRVKSIGEQAFYNCRALRNVTMPDSITEIADNIFNGTNLIGTAEVSLMALDGAITCSEGSAAHAYAAENGIRANIVSSEELNIKKTATSAALLSDGSYLLDIINVHSMNGVLHIDLYSEDQRLMSEKIGELSDVEYRAELSAAELSSVEYAKIYVTDESGAEVSTEAEIVTIDANAAAGEIEMSYSSGMLSFTGDIASLQGKLLIQAIYADDGSIESIYTYPIDGEEIFKEVYGDFEPGKAKFMLWNSFDSMTPAADAITV